MLKRVSDRKFVIAYCILHFSNSEMYGSLPVIDYFPSLTLYLLRTFRVFFGGILVLYPVPWRVPPDKVINSTAGVGCLEGLHV